MKQVVQAVKGTRDFYPEEMAFRRWLYAKIQQVSERFGYQEFDGPIIEYIDLYSDKTSEEILKDQAFSLQDRDGRTILLRPEITPTFARMVAQKSGSLIKPIRWYSYGRGYRYEQPQKGRGREFFQWEINILGPETPEADAEIIAIAVEFFKQLNLTPVEVVIKVNDRTLLEQTISVSNIPAEKFTTLLRLIDRKEKIGPIQFNQTLKEEGLDQKQIDGLNSYLSSKDYTKSDWLSKVFKCLEKYPGVMDYIEFDPTIARGFDYYTRTVFEAWDRSGGLRRSLFGGGRFDNLTETLGGERIPGVGMAPGDMPIEEILKQFKKIPDLKPETAKVLVTVFNAELMENSLAVASLLRSKNINTELWLEDSKLDKQLKYADQKGIPYAIIIGPDEATQDKVVLKDLTKQSQESLTLEEIIPILL